MKNKQIFKQSVIKTIKYSFVFTVALFSLHKYIEYHFFNDIELYHPIYLIYFFLFISLIVLFYFILKAASNKPETIFTTFAVGSLAKSAIAVLFFLPLFFKDTTHLNHTVFNFFIPYFLYVFFEIYLIQFFFKDPNEKPSGK